MNKTLFILLFAILAVKTFALDFQYEYEGQTLTYHTISETECSVTGSRYLNGGDLIIPKTVINDDVEYTITNIAEAAFSNCVHLQSVIIPNTITKIERDAFHNCISLSVVNIPNSLIKIDDCAFSGCSGVKEIIIEDGSSTLIFGKFAFSKGGVDILKPLDIEKLYIGRNFHFDNNGTEDGAPFALMDALTNLTIGNQVTMVDDMAFTNIHLDLVMP